MLRWKGEQATACTGPAWALYSPLMGFRNLGAPLSAIFFVNSASEALLCWNMHRYTMPPVRVKAHGGSSPDHELLRFGMGGHHLVRKHRVVHLHPVPYEDAPVGTQSDDLERLLLRRMLTRLSRVKLPHHLSDWFTVREVGDARFPAEGVLLAEVPDIEFSVQGAASDQGRMGRMERDALKWVV
eukprot:9436980-Pyramimonas_sp.AAC.1